jgi:hypothetical protein
MLIQGFEGVHPGDGVELGNVRFLPINHDAQIVELNTGQAQ